MFVRKFNLAYAALLVIAITALFTYKWLANTQVDHPEKERLMIMIIDGWIMCFSSVICLLGSWASRMQTKSPSDGWWRPYINGDVLLYFDLLFSLVIIPTTAIMTFWGCRGITICNCISVITLAITHAFLRRVNRRLRFYSTVATFAFAWVTVDIYVHSTALENLRPLVFGGVAAVAATAIIGFFWLVWRIILEVAGKGATPDDQIYRQ